CAHTGHRLRERKGGVARGIARQYSSSCPRPPRAVEPFLSRPAPQKRILLRTTTRRRSTCRSLSRVIPEEVVVEQLTLPLSWHCCYCGSTERRRSNGSSANTPGGTHLVFFNRFGRITY